MHGSVGQVKLQYYVHGSITVEPMAERKVVAYEVVSMLVRFCVSNSNQDPQARCQQNTRESAVHRSLGQALII